MLKPFNSYIKVALAACLIMSSCAIGMDEPIVNGFTGEVTLRTESCEFASTTTNAYTSDYLVAYFTLNNTEEYLFHVSLDANYGYQKSFAIKKGAKLYLKLRNDSVITLVNMEDATAADVITRTTYYRLRYWSADAVFAVSVDETNKLAASNFTGARIETDAGLRDFSISPSESKTINKLAMLTLKAASNH
ncbi:MAG: hypothetical protein ABIN13_00725 [Mucilaginibacter sp.]